MDWLEVTIVLAIGMACCLSFIFGFLVAWCWFKPLAQRTVPTAGMQRLQEVQITSSRTQVFHVDTQCNSLQQAASQTTLRRCRVCA